MNFEDRGTAGGGPGSGVPERTVAFEPLQEIVNLKARVNQLEKEVAELRKALVGTLEAVIKAAGKVTGE